MANVETDAKVTKARKAGKVCEFMPYGGREAFKRLRTNIQLAFPEDSDGCKVIGVTSAQVSEGKSTVAIDLAYSLAELGNKVLLIDSDMRRPSIHDKLAIDDVPGLSEVLSGTHELKELVKVYQSSTDETKFGILPSGTIPENPSELLNSRKFKAMIRNLSADWDYVVIDLPPVNAVVDAVNVAGCTDGMIVVVREGHCPKYVLNDCVEQLRYARATILGFVMNGCVEGSKRYNYRNGYYKYNQQYYK